jgi:hypothetical protein
MILHKKCNACYVEQFKGTFRENRQSRVRYVGSRFLTKPVCRQAGLDNNGFYFQFSQTDVNLLYTLLNLPVVDF